MDFDRHRFIGWFREASPYIHRFRGETFVIVLGGDLLSDGRIRKLAHDIALLASLGIRLVLSFGAAFPRKTRRSQKTFSEEPPPPVPPVVLTSLMQEVGRLRLEIEAALSQGTDATPMAGARLRVAGGNFVIGRPLGVLSGVDLLYAGTVRRIEAEAVRRHLDAGEVVLLPPFGFSPTGELFYIPASEIASRAAVALEATKLILLDHAPEIRDGRGEVLRQLTLGEARKNQERSTIPLHPLLEALDAADLRLHLLDAREDGALLLELFTRDGIGTLISRDPFEHIRKATLDDLVEILDIIRPLEEKGILVERPRERIEMELDHFTVASRDRSVIGCVSLTPYPEEGSAEMACLALLPEYQGEGRGGQLLAWCRREAHRQGLETLFVLTTQSSRWFIERGFREGRPEDLPPDRRRLYDPTRKSQILISPASP
ncbi:MAG: amino-acid N-acetyltransferase [Leptospirillia bacterium]